MVLLPIWLTKAEAARRVRQRSLRCWIGLTGRGLPGGGTYSFSRETSAAPAQTRRLLRGDVQRGRITSTRAAPSWTRGRVPFEVTRLVAARDVFVHRGRNVYHAPSF